MEEDLKNAYGEIDGFFAGATDYLNVKARFYCFTSDSYQWAQIVSQTIEKDKKGNPKTMTGIMMNIQEQKLREEKLLQESIVDELTGLYNSRYLNKHLNELRKEKNLNIVVGYFAILGLRHINNSYGYENGEKLILHVAQMLYKLKSKNTSIFRVANDEFVVVTTDKFVYKNVVNNIPLSKIEDDLKGSFKTGDIDLNYQLSCGVLAYPHNTDDFDNIIYLSEMTMMYGKDNKQYIQYYDCKVIEDIIHERSVIKDFNDADLEKEFVLYYQPVVDIKHNKLSSFEALVRWNHPEKGLLAPGYFIDILEKARLLNKLTPILFKQALSQILKWKQETGEDISISFNLSPSNIGSEKVVKKLLSIIEETGIDKKQITIELVEGSFDSDDKRVLNNIDEINKSGMGIAIDDFGVSYSSLSRVSNIEYDVLKIDRSFADNVEKKKNKDLVDVIFSIAKLCDAKCVAEGIENQSQLEVYKDIGIEYIQGYYLYRPMPPSDITKLLSKEL